MERLSRLAFQTQTKKQIRRFQLRYQRRGRGTPTGGLSLPEHTPASSGCLRFFFPQIGLSPAAPRCNSCGEHKQTTTTAGEMGCEGNSPGGHFLEPRCYNYSNSADTWLQQDLTRSGDNSHSSPTPGNPTGQRCSVLARWDENTHIRLLSRSSSTACPHHVGAGVPIHQARQWPRLSHCFSKWNGRLGREGRSGKAPGGPSSHSPPPPHHPFPTPPPLPRLRPSSSFSST